MNKTLFAVLAMALVFSTVAASAYAECFDVRNQFVPVGEARYRLNDGSDSGYANAYGDGGDELKHDWGSEIGYLSSGVFHVNVNTLLEDKATNDCGDDMGMYYSIKTYQTPVCGSSYTNIVGAGYYVDTCTPHGQSWSNTWKATAFRTVSIYSLSWNTSFEAEIWTQVNGNSINSDTGCFALGSNQYACDN